MYVCVRTIDIGKLLSDEDTLNWSRRLFLLFTISESQTIEYKISLETNGLVFDWNSNYS